MSMTGLKVFDTTLQETNAWLRDLMQDLSLQDKQEAYHDLRVALHALRDRLTVQEVAHLAAQLPMLLRGLFYEGWNPTGKPIRERRLEEFLAAMEREHRGDHRVDFSAVARGVFSVMSKHVAPGEIKDVKQQLPSQIRDLWPEEAHG